MPAVPPFPPALIVAFGVFAAVAATGVVLILGGWAIRLLRLPNDLPIELALEPPTPPLCPAGDRAAAAARAAAWRQAAERGRRTLALGSLAGGVADLAEWIAFHERERGLAARAAAAAVKTAAERARAACEAGDENALAACEREALTAAEQARVLAAGLPDLQAAERRKLLLLIGALIAALVLAAFSLCLP